MKNINEQSIGEFLCLLAGAAIFGLTMAYMFNSMADWVVGL